MKKTVLLSFMIMCMLSTALAQDMITLKNGDEIKARVTEIDLNVIKYKKFENLNGPTYNIEKHKVFMIKYENGTKDIINEISDKETPSKPTATNLQETPAKTAPVVSPPKSDAPEQTDLCKLGKTDADGNYKSTGATIGTFATTILTTPIIGLIPAIACSSTAPSDINLRMPATYSDNALYKNCYRERAWKSKKSNTWIGWMSGTAIWLTVVGLLIQ